jgi:hypothetical protein
MSGQYVARRSKSAERRSIFGSIERGWLPADLNGKEEHICDEIYEIRLG